MNCRASMEDSQQFVPIAPKFTDPENEITEYRIKHHSIDLTTNGNILKERMTSPNVLDRLILDNAYRKLKSDMYGAEGSRDSGNSSVHKCTKCERSFSRPLALRRHEKNCGIPPYLFCKFCPYGNKHRGDLKVHIKSNHRDKLKSNAEFEKIVQSIIEEGKRLQASSLEALHNGTREVIKPKPRFDSTRLINRYCAKCAKVYAKGKNCPACQTPFLFECEKCRKRSKHYSVIYHHTKKGCNFEKSFQPDPNDSCSMSIKSECLKEMGENDSYVDERQMEKSHSYTDERDAEDNNSYIDENDQWASQITRRYSNFGTPNAENLSIAGLFPAHGSNSEDIMDLSIPEKFRETPKMYDYLSMESQQDFWEQLFTRRVMDAIRSNEIGMMTAAKLLGVSYGTLYSRYRNNFG